MSKLQPVCVWFSLVFTVSKYGYHLACCPRHHWVIFILLNAPVSSQQSKAHRLLITTEAVMKSILFCTMITIFLNLCENHNSETCCWINFNHVINTMHIIFCKQDIRWVCWNFITILGTLQALHSVSWISSWFLLTRTLNGL